MNPSDRPHLPEPTLPFPSMDDANNGIVKPVVADQPYWDFCPNCGGRLVNQRCKYRCLRCHYFVSCSDFD